MDIKGNNPLSEIIARSMFGLNNCDCIYYQKMVNKCCKKALEYHNKQIRIAELGGEENMKNWAREYLYSYNTTPNSGAGRFIKEMLTKLERK